MQIELQQHRLQTRKTKFLLTDAIFLPRLSTPYIPFLPLITMSIILRNSKYLKKKKKSSKQRFSLFFLSGMHRMKTLLSLPSCQQIFKGSWVAGTVQRYKFTAMRMVVDDNSCWVEKAQIKNNQVSITACRNIQ